MLLDGTGIDSFFRLLISLRVGIEIEVEWLVATITGYK